MSQGYIGYHLQQGIGREMHRRCCGASTPPPSSPRSSATRTTPRSPTPPTPIGPSTTPGGAGQEIIAEPRDGLRRGLPAAAGAASSPPRPKKKIVEADSRLNLPTTVHRHRLRRRREGSPWSATTATRGRCGGAAVIDKDMGGELARRGLRRGRTVPADRRRARRHQLRQARPAGARGAHRRRGRAPRRRGPLLARAPWSPRYAPPSSSPASARAAPASSALGQGRRDHGRPLRHPHLRLTPSPFSRATCKLTSLLDALPYPAGRPRLNGIFIYASGPSSRLVTFYEPRYCLSQSGKFGR